MGKCIAVDWGTSNARFYLCEFIDDEVAVLAELSGPGIAQCDDPEKTYREITKDWYVEDPTIPAILSGMVGSSIGWKNVPYRQAPYRLYDMGRHLHPIKEANIWIVPGLECSNAYGSPDVMRGEELQLLGTITAFSEYQKGEWFFCLPGTHAKWVRVNDGIVVDFSTSASGELYNIIKEHSVLVGECSEGVPVSKAVFADGVERMRDKAGYLLQSLFSVRSSQLCSGYTPEEAASFLSGLIIGADVTGAKATYGLTGESAQKVTIIGESKVADLYRLALELNGCRANTVDARQCGLQAYNYLWNHFSK